MARLADVPVALRRVGLLHFLRRLYSEVNEDRLLTWAAALAYSWLFAVFPFIICLLALVPYLPLDRERVMAAVNDFYWQTLPYKSADTMIRVTEQVLSTRRDGLLSLGFILAIWVASGGMAMTMAAMNECFDVKENRPFYTQRALSILLTIVVAILILLVLVLLPIGTQLQRWAREHFGLGPLWVWTFNIVRWALALSMMITVLAVVYHFGPRVKRRFRWLTPGGVFTLTVWIGLGLLARFYFDRFGSYDKTYGTIGGVVILLMVFYLDSLVLLIGAEIDSEIDYALHAKPLVEEPPVDSDLPVDQLELRKPDEGGKREDIRT